MTIRFNGRCVGWLAVCLLATAVTDCVFSFSWAQSAASPSPGAVTSKPPGNSARRHQYFYGQRAAPFDRIPEGAYQRAREYHIQTWGMAPGQQTQNLPNTLPVTRWSSIGPTRITTNLNTSGRINSIALHPTDSDTIYVAAADGGVWKNTAGGWLPLTDDQCSLSMGSVVVDPVNPNLVYAGTGDPAPSTPTSTPGGCGILRSTDGGTTWVRALLPVLVVVRLFIDPATAGSTTATKIFAATSSGLFRSTDSGSTWTGSCRSHAGQPMSSSILRTRRSFMLRSVLVMAV